MTEPSDNLKQQIDRYMEESDNLEQQIDHYMKDRVEQYAQWYDKKAVKLKASFLRSRVGAAIGAVLVPVISNITLNWTLYGITLDLTRIMLSLIGVLVAILLALEGVLNYREHWKNYRTTEQYILSQKYLFEYRVGEYSNGSLEEAFKTFVRNIETAIKNENEITLNVLARADASEALPPTSKAS